jgi:hypothetical protein
MTKIQKINQHNNEKHEATRNFKNQTLKRQTPRKQSKTLNTPGFQPKPKGANTTKNAIQKLNFRKPKGANQRHRPAPNKQNHTAANPLAPKPFSTKSKNALAKNPQPNFTFLENA